MVSDEEYALYQNQIAEARNRADQEHIQTIQQEIEMEGQEKSMIREQLDLGEELDRIDYLLRGYTIKNDKWTAPDNDDMVVLSDYGVHLIRNTIAWYLNKNTLLSNYDEKTIMIKMHDFASDLNDTLFMEYEKVFQYPTDEVVQAELKKKIEKRINLKTFCSELLGKKLGDLDKKEIREEILKELEPRVEKELERIKQNLMKSKYKRYLIIMREVQDAVHSTYLRAYGGQERKTLREHIHISENKGGINLSSRSISPQSPLSFLRRR